MKKISFDFDSTLDNKHIQDFALQMISEGYDVHIVTSRPPETDPDWKWDNSDLFEVANKLGINKNSIHFTNFKPKYMFFEHSDFLFHLDDDNIETTEINYHTKVKAIQFDENWKMNCLKSI